MEARVTFKINYYQDNEKKSGICLGEILCGDVEGDGLPIPVYMAILKAMLEVEDILNWEEPEVHVPHPGLPITSPGESLEEMGATSEDIIKKYIEDQPSVSPPTPKIVVPMSDKKIKRYTVEEKTEIAMMYANGVSVATIAEKFGRKPNAILVLVNKMGVKRGDNPIDQQADASKPASKPGSVLKKPWYLQSQKVNNKDKVKHEQDD